MEVRLLRDFRGKETDEVFYRAGEIAAVRDHHAKRLIELGFAVEYDAWEGVEKLPPPPPLVDPTLETKSMMTPKVAALVEKDNDAIVRSLREEMLAEEEAHKSVPPFIDEPEPEPAPKPKRGKKAKK